ncbi:TPA: hypothetical protein DDW35_03980, partial [Candidatus Sumerlaeota bacterium]|nr:hypothetical protein [Candidatus Sumerlaeota bacterium]
MTPLTANLKLFQQSWLGILGFLIAFAMWYFWFAGVLLFTSTSSPEWTPRIYGCFLSFSFLVALVAGLLQRDALCKPFTFLLPGHHDIPRRVLTRVGCVANLVGLVFLLVEKTPSAGFYDAVVWAMVAYLGGLVVYALGVFLVFYFSGPDGIMITAYVAMFLWCLVDWTFLLTHPLPAIVILFAALYGFWYWMDAKCLARKNCGKLYYSFQNIWNRNYREEWRQAHLRQKWATSRMGEGRLGYWL